MKNFIKIDKTDVVDARRLTGFTGDGNRMGLQTLAAMSTVMILQLKDKGNKLVRYVVLLALLLVCGCLTVSKMFLLEAALLILLWGYAFYRQKGSADKKIGLLMVAAVAVLVILGSGVLDTQIDIYLRRFGISTDMSAFTTGRTDLWKIYIEYLWGNMDAMAVGKGWMTEYLYSWLHYKPMAPHNIVLESVYRLGVLGSCFLIAWMFTFYKRCIPAEFRLHNVPMIIQLIVGAGFFLPWFALPTMDFDEFFLLPVSAMYALYYYSYKRK